MTDMGTGGEKPMQGGIRGRNALTNGDPGKSLGTGSITPPGN
ncbi:hypothetical protein [Pseudorhodobacter sp.]|nr:hypothetical protein [Pseudorhodobacter sp.]